MFQFHPELAMCGDKIITPHQRHAKRLPGWDADVFCFA